MIKLYGFGPMFGVPDPSAFVVKSQVHLAMAGLPYTFVRTNPSKGPKGKLPYIDDNGVTIADSTFIRDHIEKTYRIDLDWELTREARGQAWAAERLAEDHLYWASLYDRWMDDTSFAKGPAQFFEGLPEDRRAAVREKGRAATIQMIVGHGLGRHSPEEMLDLAGRSLAALSAMLGEKPYLMGEKPCGADASVFAQLIEVQTPYFDTALSEKARSFPNLMGYSTRMMRKFFPDFR